MVAIEQLAELRVSRWFGGCLARPVNRPGTAQHPLTAGPDLPRRWEPPCQGRVSGRVTPEGTVAGDRPFVSCAHLQRALSLSPRAACRVKGTGGSPSPCRLGGGELPRHLQKIPQRVVADVAEADQDEWIGLIVAGEVVGFRRVLQQPLPLLDAVADNKRIGFGRLVTCEAGHEASAEFEYRRTIVPNHILDTWQLARSGPDRVEQHGRRMLSE